MLSILEIITWSQLTTHSYLEKAMSLFSTIQTLPKMLAWLLLLFFAFFVLSLLTLFAIRKMLCWNEFLFHSYTEKTMIILKRLDSLPLATVQFHITIIVIFISHS